MALIFLSSCDRCGVRAAGSFHCCLCYCSKGGVRRTALKAKSIHNYQSAIDACLSFARAATAFVLFCCLSEVAAVDTLAIRSPNGSVGGLDWLGCESTLPALNTLVLLRKRR